MNSIIGPASYLLFDSLPLFRILAFLIPLIGVVAFCYIMSRRILPLMKAAPDYRFDNVPQRIKNLFL